LNLHAVCFQTTSKTHKDLRWKGAVIGLPAATTASKTTTRRRLAHSGCLVVAAAARTKRLHALRQKRLAVSRTLDDGDH